MTLISPLDHSYCRIGDECVAGLDIDLTPGTCGVCEDPHRKCSRHDWTPLDSLPAEGIESET